MLCRSRTLVHYDDNRAVAVTLRCRSWGCELCGPERARQLVAEAMAGCPDRFVTLTIKSTIGASPADRARMLARAWRVTLARWRRRHPGQRHEYLAVFEATLRGEPHLHILVRGPYIAQRWLSAQMAELIKSPVVDIRRVVSGRGVASYVAKYIGKAPHRFGSCKRYWRTAGWIVEHRPDDGRCGGWSLDDRPLWSVEEDWRAAGATVERTGADEIVATWPAWRAQYFPRAGPWAVEREGGWG